MSQKSLLAMKSSSTSKMKDCPRASWRCRMKRVRFRSKNLPPWIQHRLTLCARALQDSGMLTNRRTTTPIFLQNQILAQDLTRPQLIWSKGSGTKISSSISYCSSKKHSFASGETNCPTWFSFSIQYSPALILCTLIREVQLCRKCLSTVMSRVIRCHLWGNVLGKTAFQSATPFWAIQTQRCKINIIGLMTLWRVLPGRMIWCTRRTSKSWP